MNPMEVEMEITSEMVSNERVINQLKKQFEKFIDLEIIESVAYECEYDENLATNHLLDICQDLSPLVTHDLIDLTTDSQDSSDIHPLETNYPAVRTTQNIVDNNVMQVIEIKDLPEQRLIEGLENQAEQPQETLPNEVSQQSLQLKTDLKQEIENVKMKLITSVKPEQSLGAEAVNIKYENPNVKSMAEANIDRIIADVKRGIKVLILLRGPPGSGKSYLGNRIIRESIGNCDPRSFILSADDFFNRNGAYIYESSKISDAHKWNQNRAHSLLNQGVSPVIIDNTNTQLWEMKPYCMWAVDNSYAIEVLEPVTPWAFNERELVKRNVHNVPRNRIREMLDRYERGITVEVLFERLNLCYRKKLPPQPRVYPIIPPREVKILNTGWQDGNQMIMQPEEEAMQSWSILEPEPVNQTNPFYMVSDTKEIGTMTGTKNPFSALAEKLIVPKDFASAPLLPYKLPRDGFLDSSTMTEEPRENNDMEIENLSKLFQQIPIEYLKDVYEKCQHDIDWTVDILLADKKEIIQNYTPPPSKERHKEIKIEETTEEKMQIETPKKMKQGKSEIAASLKKALETSVVLSEDSYSNNLRKLKKMDAPSTSKAETCSTSAGTVIIIDSDEEFDGHYEIDLTDDSDSSETIELKVGHDFIRQLNNAFGEENSYIPNGFQPIIEVPVSLGRQLHALYLESLSKYIDMQSTLMEQMLKEDEEFAKKLQEQEFREIVEETPNLKQIMMEQKDMSKHQKIIDEWKNLTPDDLAYKMTKQKLTRNFPQTDPETLFEILAAHNNCYKETVDALISSGLTESDDVDTSVPVSDTLLMDMKVSHESVNTNDEDIVGKSAPELREEARQFQRKRQELLQKANRYCSMGLYPVALFYAELAHKQTYLCERYHTLAAQAFLSENFSQINHYNTIDLHYLHVPEAIEALDRFLDNNIMLLVNGNKKRSEDLHIVTGRGKNSRFGKPRIRPAVHKRLMERGIKMEKVNAGLIRARIYRNTMMTTSL